MYTQLESIGIKTYLDDYFFLDKHFADSWLVALDTFVSRLSITQRNTLREKFNRKITHVSVNDHLHEIMIACAFYPNAIFNDGPGPDLIQDDQRIEVKTINASRTELERVDQLKPESTRDFIAPDLEYEQRFRNKWDLRINKALDQLQGKGVIWIVWDSDLVVGFSKRKKDIELLLTDLRRTQAMKTPDVVIRTIYFADLRSEVEMKSI